MKSNRIALLLLSLAAIFLAQGILRIPRMVLHTQASYDATRVIPTP